MALILNQIPEQNFETLRDVIGQILADELGNQGTLQPGTVFENVTVWKERFIPFDKTDLPVIDVIFNNYNFEEKDPSNSKGVAKYTIKGYASSAHRSREFDGDTLAAKQLHKLLGAIRYILEHPLYIRLLQTPGIISGSSIESIRITEPENTGDGTHAITGQIEFNVRLRELNGTIDTVPLQEVGASLKLEESEKGFFYEYIKP